MARKSNRQKYNFLAGFCTQLEEAMDEDDELAETFGKLIAEYLTKLDEDFVTREGRTYVELEDRVAKCEQWLAQHESALEELDNDGCEGSGEEPHPYDDGDYDADDTIGDEPPVVSVRGADRRVAPPVGGAREGREQRRSVAPERLTSKRIPGKGVR